MRIVQTFLVFVQLAVEEAEVAAVVVALAAVVVVLVHSPATVAVGAMAPRLLPMEALPTAMDVSPLCLFSDDMPSALLNLSQYCAEITPCQHVSTCDLWRMDHPAPR